MNFADDINMTGRSQRVFEEAVLNLEKALKGMGLNNKWKYDQTYGRKQERAIKNTQYLIVNGYIHEKFKYLGKLVTSSSNMQVELHQ